MPEKFSMEGSQDWNAPVTATPIEDLRALKALATERYGRRFMPVDELVWFYDPAEPRKGKGDPQGGEWTAGGPTGGPDVHGTWQEGEGSLGSPNAAVGQGGANPPNQPGYQGAATGPHVTPIGRSTAGEEARAIAFVNSASRMNPGKVTTREEAVQSLISGAEVTYKNALNRTAVSWTGEGQSAARDKVWYYHANALARRFAHAFGFNNSTSAGVIAAYSPQSGWLFPEQETEKGRTSHAMAAIEDVRLAQHTMEQVGLHSQDTIEITQNDMDVWEKGVKTVNWQKGMKPKGWKPGDAYDEADPRIKSITYPGKSVYGIGRYTGPETEFQGFVPKVGTYKQEDLPTEYLVDLWARDGSVRGMHAMMVNGAMIARGHSVDEVLRGCKTRSFYNDIVDPQHVQDATVDVHMLRALTQNEGLDSQKSGALGTEPGGYAIANEAIQRGAALHGLRPHEYQAMIWEEWRKENPPPKRAKLTKADPTIGRSTRKQDSAAISRKAHQGAQATMSDLARFDTSDQPMPQDQADTNDYSKPEKLGEPLDIYNVSKDEPPWDDEQYQADQERTLEIWEQLGEQDHGTKDTTDVS